MAVAAASPATTESVADWRCSMTIIAALIFYALVAVVLVAGWHDMHESPTQKGKS